MLSKSNDERPVVISFSPLPVQEPIHVFDVEAIEDVPVQQASTERAFFKFYGQMILFVAALIILIESSNIYRWIAPQIDASDTPASNTLFNGAKAQGLLVKFYNLDQNFQSLLTYPFSDPPVAVRVDYEISTTWGFQGKGPANNVNERFAAIWTGYLNINSDGIYSLGIETESEAYLYIDSDPNPVAFYKGRLISTMGNPNDWKYAKVPNTFQTDLPLSVGQHDIVIKLYNEFGPGHFNFYSRKTSDAPIINKIVFSSPRSVEPLHLQEVELFSGLEMIPKADLLFELSSVIGPFVSGNCNNGMYSTMQDICHTAGPGDHPADLNPTLTISFAARRLDQITIYNRKDCCWDRLSSFTVSIYSQDNQVWTKNFFTVDREVISFFIGNPAKGRILQH